MSDEQGTWQRIVLGAVAWPGFFAAIAYAPLWANCLLFALAAFVAAIEVCRLTAVGGGEGTATTGRHVPAGVLASGTVLLMMLPVSGEVRLGLLALVALSASVMQWMPFRPPSTPSATLPLTLVVCYVAIPLAVLVPLIGEADGRVWTALLFAGTWSRDVGAFVVGKLTPFARPIAPHISPRKTWLGALGGVGGASLCCVGFAWQWPGFLSFEHALILGALLGVLGQLGDLFESALKRHDNARHSGTLLGAQGGILDTIDGHLLTAPAVVLYAYAL